MYNPGSTYDMEYNDDGAYALNTGENTNQQDQTVSTTNQERDRLAPKKEALKKHEIIANELKRINEILNQISHRKETPWKREQLEQQVELEKPKQQSKQGKKRVSWNLCQARLENEQQQGGTQGIDGFLKLHDIAKHDSGKAGNISTKVTPWYNSTISEVEFAHCLHKHIGFTDILVRNAYKSSNSHPCIRCHRHFHVNDEEEYANKDACVFHWGKFEERYTCCGGNKRSQGCESCEWHDWHGVRNSFYGNVNEFRRTQQRSDKQSVCLFCLCGANKVFALDCEMRYAESGIDVSKVSLVDYDGDVVYQHFVRPTSDMFNFNTPSDIWKQQHKKTLDEVREDLLQLIDADTILIGHGVANTLHVLRIIHKKFFDTAYEFPHPAGYPYRHSLKTMAEKYLHRLIQCKDTGDDSLENSRASLDLAKFMVHNNMLTNLFSGCIS